MPSAHHRLGESGVTSRPTTSKVCRVMSQLQRTASVTARTGPNCLTTVFGAMRSGPGPESGVMGGRRLPSRRCGTRGAPTRAPTIGGSRRRSARGVVDREDGVVRAQPGCLAGWPGSTWPRARAVDADRPHPLGGGASDRRAPISSPRGERAGRELRRAAGDVYCASPRWGRPCRRSRRSRRRDDAGRARATRVTARRSSGRSGCPPPRSHM